MTNTDEVFLAEAISEGAILIAGALDRVASALHRLGNADAQTPFGAIEALGIQVKAIANALEELKPFSV